MPAYARALATSAVVLAAGCSRGAPPPTGDAGVAPSTPPATTGTAPTADAGATGTEHSDAGTPDALGHAGPAGVASIPFGPETRGGALPDALRVVAGMRGGFRRCYSDALAKNPQAAAVGKVELEVSTQGEVTRATARLDAQAPAGLAACLEGVARRARFSPPAGGPAQVRVPVTFQPQE